MSYAHDLARRYNETMHGRDPQLAERAEWYVTDSGDLRLRSLPGFVQGCVKRSKRKAEAEQKRWAEEHHLKQRPFAPEPEQVALDV